MSDGGVSARAASCTSTKSASPTAARARRTDSVRSIPPATAMTSPPRISLASSVRSAGTATTTPSTTPESSKPVTARCSIGRPHRSTNAFGAPAASRSPDPAAGTTATVRIASGRGGQHLVEDDCRLGVVGVLGQRQLTDQDLPRLGQHPLLARGKAALLVTTPQVAHHFGDLVHVTGGKLLQVRLVAARPVGGFFGMRGAEHLEYLVEALLPDHVTHADILGVVGGYSNGEVSLRHFQNEIFLLFAFDGSGFDRLDQRSTVVWIDNGVSDLENHQIRAPFDVPILTRRSDTCGTTVQVRGTAGEEQGLTR